MLGCCREGIEVMRRKRKIVRVQAGGFGGESVSASVREFGTADSGSEASGVVVNVHSGQAEKYVSEGTIYGGINL